MKKVLLVVFLWVFAMYLSGCISNEPHPPQLPTPTPSPTPTPIFVTFSGIVTDTSTNNPLQGVNITYGDDGDSLGTTNSSGEFSINALAGSVVEFTKDNYLQHEIQLDYTSITGNIGLVSTVELVSYYPFTNNADDVINGNNGSVHGATLCDDRFNRTNHAYDFNGRLDYISLPPLWGDNVIDFSITAWVAPVDSFGDKCVFYSGPGNLSLYLQHNNSGGFLGLDLTLSDFIFYNCSGFYNKTSEWSFIAFVRKGGTTYTYITDKLNPTSNLPRDDNSPSNVLPSVLALFYTSIQTKSFAIGVSSPECFGNMPFYGKIDDVSVFQRALSVEECKSLATYEIK